MRLVLATANPEKAAELAAILEDELGDMVDLVARPEGVPAVEETGVTLKDNAASRLSPSSRRLASPRRRRHWPGSAALGGAPGTHAALRRPDCHLR